MSGGCLHICRRIIISSGALKNDYGMAFNLPPVAALSITRHYKHNTTFAKHETANRHKMEKAPKFKLILGSSSISRQAILADMGYEFTTMSADIDEKGIRKDKPEDLVMALAEAKADAIISKLQNDKLQKSYATPTLLIAADTVVVYEGIVREKPSCKEEARQFVKDYSNGHAATVTSVFVSNLKTGVRRGEWDRVEIYFHKIPEEAIDKLIDEGRVLSVAGGLIIEHPLISPCVKEVVGTTDSVMGLPKALTEKLMNEVL